MSKWKYKFPVAQVMLDGDQGQLHDKRFKEIEDEALALWRIKIIRQKAYPKELYVNGKKIYNILR